MRYLTEAAETAVKSRNELLKLFKREKFETRSIRPFGDNNPYDNYQTLEMEASTTLSDYSIAEFRKDVIAIISKAGYKKYKHPNRRKGARVLDFERNGGYSEGGSNVSVMFKSIRGERIATIDVTSPKKAKRMTVPYYD